ncbi:hypothetical protein [Christensenella tenuis]|jgi:hypothetical protein|uniref:Uncharacterized protein n=1 Tax=Christensenella tenuis TaxID=2763033 RepID=A0ABR7EFD3_9FIRM|nr:hypothetical protein [Christensenella tenuis]MBC5648096.1 hypothetical protein [Christensenella tenuis]
MKEKSEEKKRETLNELDEKMREFAKERQKLNQMSSERIALGKPLTDGELLRQNRTCDEIGVTITQLQEFLDEIEGD